jgi:hypothetical protein
MEVKLPVTTKAQQKADNADGADNAEGESAIFIGLFAKAGKNPVKQKRGSSPPLRHQASYYSSIKPQNSKVRNN